jgi:hypothetical protein
MNSHILDMLDALHERFRRWRWWIRLGLAVVLVPWFSRFAYVRITSKPVRNASVWDILDAPPPPAGDPTKALLDAMPGAYSVPMPAPSTAPAGMRWAPANADFMKPRRVGPRSDMVTPPSLGWQLEQESSECYYRTGAGWLGQGFLSQAVEAPPLASGASSHRG